MKKVFGKMNPITVNFLMMIIALTVLILPAGILVYSESWKTAKIMDVQADYYNGTSIGFNTPNTTIINDIMNVQTNLGNESGFDCAYFGIRSTPPEITKRSIYYANWITYIGNNTYHFDTNTSVMPDSTYDDRMVIAELNIKQSDFADFDFVRITQTFSDDVSKYDIVYPNTIPSGYLQTVYGKTATTSTQTIIITSLADKIDMENTPNGTVYFLMEKSDISTDFTVSIEGFNLIGDDALTWTDDQIYVLTLLGCDILMIIGLVFTTNFIDVKIDRETRRKSKRKR